MLIKKKFISSLLLLLIYPVFLASLPINTVIDKNTAEITIEKLLGYLNENTNYTKSINAINIIKKYTNDKSLYFAQIQSDFSWDTELYLIEENEGEISDLSETGAGGLERLFEFEIIEISQGTFIAAYCSSHTGNGDLALISFEELGKAKYTFPAIGYYAALQSKDTALKKNLFLGYSSDFYDTHIFVNGKLNAEYIDINKDGTTDITLKGIQQIYDINLKEERELIKEYYYSQVYLYDETKDIFIYNTLLSQITEINN